MHTTSSVSEILTNTITNTNSDSEAKNTNTKTLTTVRLIATQISEKLNNPLRFKYYCKVAWKLPESTIWLNLEAAMSGKEPEKLFSYLCKQDMERR